MPGERKTQEGEIDPSPFFLFFFSVPFFSQEGEIDPSPFFHRKEK